jgi:hypothetical protein
MRIRTLIFALILTAGAHAEERTIEQTLSSLSNIIVPSVNFSDDTTVEEAVEFLNMTLRAPDPPPPREWKIHLDLSEELLKKKVNIVGRNLNLHQILGRLADGIGAEVLIARNGFTLRQPTKKEAQQAAPSNR